MLQAFGRGAMPDGLAVQTVVVAEKDRVASIGTWDGTVTGSGNAVDFRSADFLRIEEGVAAEHWDTVDYVRLYEAFRPSLDSTRGCSSRELQVPAPSSCAVF